MLHRHYPLHIHFFISNLVIVISGRQNSKAKTKVLQAFIKQYLIWYITFDNHNMIVQAFNKLQLLWNIYILLFHQWQITILLTNQELETIFGAERVRSGSSLPGPEITG